MMPPTPPLAFLGHAALVSDSKQQKRALTNLNRKGFFRRLLSVSRILWEDWRTRPKGATSQEQHPKAHAKGGLVENPPPASWTPHLRPTPDPGVLLSQVPHCGIPPHHCHCKAGKAHDSAISICAGRDLPPKGGGEEGPG